MQELVDIRSKTIMKNEYQKDKDRFNGGPVPAQHVLCPSRAPGSPYVQSSVYTVPDGYHGAGEQAGTMSHYECKQSTARLSQIHATLFCSQPSEHCCLSTDGNHLFIYSGR